MSLILVGDKWRLFVFQMPPPVPHTCAYTYVYVWTTHIQALSLYPTK